MIVDHDELSVDIHAVVAHTFQLNMSDQGFARAKEVDLCCYVQKLKEHEVAN